MKPFNKTILILWLSLSIAKTGYAQDLLLESYGEQTEVKVSEIKNGEAKHTLASNFEGPIYVLSESEVHIDEYKNGRKYIYPRKSAKIKASEELQSQNEILYSRALATGKVELALGGTSTLISVPFLIRGVGSLKKETGDDYDLAVLQTAISGTFTALGLTSMTLGIYSLIRAKKRKLALNDVSVSIIPKVINTASFNGTKVTQSSAVGVSLTYNW